MWKAALAGVMLATTGVTCVSAQNYETASYEQGTPADTGHASAGKVVTAGHIARLKAALHLTAAQLHYWPAVESALRGLSQRQSKDRSGDGVARRIAAAGVDANALRRVVAAAGPLIGSLDEKQRQEVCESFARSDFRASPRHSKTALHNRVMAGAQKAPAFCVLVRALLSALVCITI